MKKLSTWEIYENTQHRYYEKLNNKVTVFSQKIILGHSIEQNLLLFGISLKIESCIEEIMCQEYLFPNIKYAPFRRHTL